MSQGDWPAIETWFIWWLFLSLGLPIILPLVTGIVCGHGMVRIPWALGFLVGAATSITGFALYELFVFRFREHFYSGASEALEAFGGLACLVAVQLLMVVGILACVNRCRSRW